MMVVLKLGCNFEVVLRGSIVLLCHLDWKLHRDFNVTTEATLKGDLVLTLHTNVKVHNARHNTLL